MIEIGYIKTDGAEVIYESGLNSPEANNLISQLRESLSSSEDISTFFIQQNLEGEVNRYGYIDP